MRTLVLKKEHFDDRCNYIGKEDLSYFDGNIEIDLEMFLLCFECVFATGYILVKSGTYIRVNRSISAGSSIVVGGGIEVGTCINAGGNFRANGGVLAGESIWVDGYIDASTRIEAGMDMEAGLGIVAGLSITCGNDLCSGSRIFAGTCPWSMPEEDDLKITCRSLVSGEVCSGKLVETEVDKTQKEVNPKEVIFDGVRYNLVRAGS